MLSLFYSLFFIALTLWPASGEKSAEPAGKIRKSALEIPQNLDDFEVVRVALARSVPQIVIETASPYQVLDGEGHLLFKGNRIVATSLKASASGIRMGSQNFQNEQLIIQSPEDGGIKAGDRTYRHRVEIRRESNGTISVINEVKLEDYLKGVLPWEVHPNWPVEALKAQAVASRTFALFKAIEFQKEHFSLSHDVMSQVYAGKGIENPITNQAVDVTRGEILTFQDKIFPAYFHSTCGGATTTAESLWNIEPHSSLKGVACDFCHASRHYRWTEEMSLSDIEKALKKRGHRISGLKNISVGKTDATGRAKNFILEDDKGKTEIRANDFRLAVDPMKFKSTWIRSISTKNGRLVFQGKGWGHGAGLCQYGARGLAELGYNYRQILDYYYPGASIVNMKDRS